MPVASSSVCSFHISVANAKDQNKLMNDVKAQKYDLDVFSIAFKPLLDIMRSLTLNAQLRRVF